MYPPTTECLPEWWIAGENWAWSNPLVSLFWIKTSKDCASLDPHFSKKSSAEGLWTCTGKARNGEVKWSEVTQSCPTLCDPVDCSLPSSSVHVILQVRILEWVAISFSRGSSWPRDQTQVSDWFNSDLSIRAKLHSPINFLYLKMSWYFDNLLSLILQIEIEGFDLNWDTEIGSALGSVFVWGFDFCY